MDSNIKITFTNEEIDEYIKDLNDAKPVREKLINY